MMVFMPLLTRNILISLALRILLRRLPLKSAIAGSPRPLANTLPDRARGTIDPRRLDNVSWFSRCSKFGSDRSRFRIPRGCVREPHTLDRLLATGSEGTCILPRRDLAGCCKVSWIPEKLALRGDVLHRVASCGRVVVIWGILSFMSVSPNEQSEPYN